MPTLTKRWLIHDRLSREVDLALSDYPPVLRQILNNRKHISPEEARRYLHAETPEMTDPFLMKGIAEAVERIEWAIKRGEKIAIYGDYDVDGVTATALLAQVLDILGADVRGYIPNRFDEGYGLNKEALDHLHDSGVSLIITVDCGVRSLSEAEHGRQLGLDMIISDHHHPAKELPVARAIVNPKQPGCAYPEKDLAGVGLAYKLASALLAHLEQSGIPIPATFCDLDILDLVALGTVADLAPLTGENRSLVRTGLKAIRQPSRQGLLSLIGSAGLRPERITASDIGFIIGPRLNAAGRLDSALAAFELLTTQDLHKAGHLAQTLETQNYERQKIMREIQTAAEEIALSGKPDTLLLFAAHQNFNAGVVGLAASRLVDSYYRPAIVAQIGELYTRASCRSIPEFHITDALDQCADLLEHHGGHAAAAGFTVRNDRLPELIERLQAIAGQQLATQDLRPMLKADALLQLSELKPGLLEYLEWLQPTGFGNPQAVFVSQNLQVRSFRAVGKEGAHLKLSVSDGWVTYDAIAFRQGHWQNQMPRAVDLMYTFERNEYNGRETLQLNVRDLRSAGTLE